MRALLVAPLGFLVGLSLGALGGGGSILAVPTLVFAAGLTPQEATSTSLLVVGLAAFVGMQAHLRAGRVNVGVGVAFGLVGVFGSLVGTAVNRRLSPDALLLGFSVLILVAAWRMLTACPSCTKIGDQRAAARQSRGGRLAVRYGIDRHTALPVIGAGTVVGFLTGLFGVGGGFIIVPALTLLLGFAIPEAIGTSLLIIVINTAVALLARLGSGSIDWVATIPFAIATTSGSLVGSRISGRLPAETLLRWFAGLLVVVALGTAASVVF